jgi:putative phosphoribosyl transferase
VHEELAFGPIATGRVRLLNQDVVRSLRMSQDRIEAVAERELGAAYRRDHPAVNPSGRNVILVGDGLATV